MRFLVPVLSLVALRASAEQLPGSPLRFDVPSSAWQPRSDLALALKDTPLVDARDHGGAVVYRDESANATLQGVFGARELHGENGPSARAALQDVVAKNALDGWKIDKREHKVAGKSDIVRVESHDTEGMRSITWSAAALDGPLVTHALLQCIYVPKTLAERDCATIIASAKLTKLAR